ncbi:HAD-IIIA family hydrolase [Ferrovibrio sp.]|uniref:D-glycero-alpha-D-manno-heptose-1,7-bisphosphate 7-phosphatase n=1 Tax=Ferrovibrio sp. TaxID=1917215 RepID=UPI00261AC1A6|nr:HAD-IIIA family hydrolase [Ferrovibrio sp.]
MLILLDRDGVLNQDYPDDYVKSPAELILLPGVGEAIAKLNARGWPVALCTNQACIGKGIIDEAMLARIHADLRDRIAPARIDAIFFAPDPPWAVTDRRKPGPGMLREAMAMFRVAPHETVFIGDAVTDMQAAMAAGCRRILVRTGKGKKTQATGLPEDVLPVTIAESLPDAVARLLSDLNEPSEATTR